MAKSIVVRSLKEACADVEKKFVAAGVNAINRVAFTARANAQRLITERFTTRNTFTVRNIYTTPCKKNVSIGNIRASTGALDAIDYMARQETGGEKRSPSGANLIIPNTRARGNSNAKKVQTRYHYDNVRTNTVHSYRHGSPKARLAARAYVAAKTRKFIRIGDSFFTVSRFKKRGENISFRANQILNLKHRTTYTPPTPWLGPASEYAAKLAQDFFNQEMDKL